MKQTLLLFTLFLFALITLLSCEESEKFSSNPNLKLEFLRGTLYFDTIFTSIISPTQRLRIRNYNNNSISIESIELINAERSGFRINVNGKSGTSVRFENLLKKDSLSIFVDIKAPKTDGGNRLIKDSIRLSWNGNTTFIQLEAFALEADIWDNKTIEKDIELESDKAYYIRGAININEGVTLSIKEGTNLYFDKNGSLEINGSIEALGSVEKPISFRGHRFDYAYAKIPYDNVPDQWIGITIGENSSENLFENVRIRNSQFGLNIQSAKNISLVNTIIHNTSEYAIKAIDSDIDAQNCQISNSRGALLNLIGGKYNFTHCTFANFYEWQPRTTASILLEDAENDKTIPLNAKFINSIIVGTFKNELAKYYNPEISFSTFTNSLIQISDIESDTGFDNVLIWNSEKLFPFLYLNNNDSFTYSFELTEESAARDKANLNEAQQLPLDLRGSPRLTDGKPDIGCYEWSK